MSHRLFEATLSVPSPTLTPASIIPSSGAIPCPSFAFDFGQWATRAPYRAISLTSGWVTWTQWTSSGLVSKTPMDSRYLIVDIPGARHSIPRPARPHGINFFLDPIKALVGIVGIRTEHFSVSDPAQSAG